MNKITVHAQLCLFSFFLCILSLSLQSCKTVNNTYAIESDVKVNITIPPLADTGTLTIATGTCSYNVDSFLLASSNNAYGLRNLTIARVAALDLSMVNANTANNFANFENCRVYLYTNVDTQRTFTAWPSVPDSFASSLMNYGINNSLELYLRNTQKPYTSPIVFNYSIRAKLRRPLTDSMHCIIHFPANLLVGKTSH